LETVEKKYYVKKKSKGSISLGQSGTEKMTVNHWHMLNGGGRFKKVNQGGWVYRNAKKNKTKHQSRTLKRATNIGGY